MPPARGTRHEARGLKAGAVRGQPAYYPSGPECKQALVLVKFGWRARRLDPRPGGGGMHMLTGGG